MSKLEETPEQAMVRCAKQVCDCMESVEKALRDAAYGMNGIRNALSMMRSNENTPSNVSFNAKCAQDALRQTLRPKLWQVIYGLRNERKGLKSAIKCIEQEPERNKAK